MDVINPFSTFEFLKQAFTAIERRKVLKHRLNALINNDQIKQEQYNTFL